jgi:Fic family protein
VKDLLKAHGVMMQALIDDAGRFRRGGVGVFSEQGLVHMAPPAERVPFLMDDLFAWLQSSKDHLLIRSCVFHYEFEFIHPFIDGNGRTGRLWQSLILGRLHPLFEHLPVENMVYANQQAYYDAITASTHAGQSGPFIDFMLNEIYKTLKSHQGEELMDVGNNVGNNVGNKERIILDIIRNTPTITTPQLAEQLGVTKRQCERILSAMKQHGLLRRVGTKGGHWECLI